MSHETQTAACFGPAGNSQRFYDEGRKHTYEAMAWLAGMGLDAYEYSAGNGIAGSRETFIKIGEEARKHHIRLSLHAPYYISLTNNAPESLQKTLGYVQKSLEAADAMGADIIVIHCGSVMKLDRNDALRNNFNALYTILRETEQLAPDVALGIETMGKRNQLGTLEEVIALCSIAPRLRPVVDFGHLNAREGGRFFQKDDYRRVFDAIGDKLGTERAKYLHCHFSKIEYTAAGEKCHLTLADTQYGPSFEPLGDLLAEDGLFPRIICESSGTMADDALQMKTYYHGVLS